MDDYQKDTNLVICEIFLIVQDFKALGREWLIEGLADCAWLDKYQKADTINYFNAKLSVDEYNLAFWR